MSDTLERFTKLAVQLQRCINAVVISNSNVVEQTLGEHFMVLSGGYASVRRNVGVSV